MTIYDTEISYYTEKIAMNDIETLCARDFGYIHEDNLPNLDICEEMISLMINALYVTGNVDELEEGLENLAYQFNVDYPSLYPVMQKKNDSKIVDLLHVGEK